MALTLVLKSVNTVVVNSTPVVIVSLTYNQSESTSLLPLDEATSDESPFELPGISMATFPAIVSILYNAQPMQFLPLVTTLVQNVCIRLVSSL